MDKHFVFDPIGVFHCERKYRYETPRQGVFANNSGVIRLKPELGLRESVRDLEGFGRIWILFCFHLNETWRPMVQPPLSPGGRRVGVLATRSPHRPNPIGMSCVKLDKLDGDDIYVSEADLLDLTPVFDIKPYIPRADCFPESGTGWLEKTVADRRIVEFSQKFMEQSAFIRERSKLDPENFCRIQLGLDPVNPHRKRIASLGPDRYEIGFRTWKIEFCTVEKTVSVLGIRSNYSSEDLLPDSPDRYQDKDLHRAFVACFMR